LQELQELLALDAVLELEGGGELVELLEGEVGHGSDKIVVHVVGKPAVKCAAVEVLLEGPEGRVGGNGFGQVALDEVKDGLEVLCGACGSVRKCGEK